MGVPADRVDSPCADSRFLVGALWGVHQQRRLSVSSSGPMEAVLLSLNTEVVLEM